MAQEVTYRSKHDIRREILTLVTESPQKPTHIMFGVMMSYPQLKTYEQYLTSCGLVHIDEHTGTWNATENGKKWLKHANAMKDLEALA